MANALISASMARETYLHVPISHVFAVILNLKIYQISLANNLWLNRSLSIAFRLGRPGGFLLLLLSWRLCLADDPLGQRGLAL